jgi:hypothetical protein
MTMINRALDGASYVSLFTMLLLHPTRASGWMISELVAFYGYDLQVDDVWM